jgi:hypothetical protein
VLVWAAWYAKDPRTTWPSHRSCSGLSGAFVCSSVPLPLAAFVVDAVATRLPSQRVLPERVLPADMREAEKRKRLRLTQSAFHTSFSSVASEFDQARFFGMQ